jgi:hypothetical protein
MKHEEYKMYYYKFDNKMFFSEDEYKEFEKITETEIQNFNGMIYLLKKSEPHKSRRSFSLSHSSLLHLENEGIELLKRCPEENIPQWLISKIENRNIMCVNTLYPTWKNALKINTPTKWRINIAGLGDVGGILTTGLRLLGGEDISKIGIFDLDENKIKRWEFEANQILSSSEKESFPEVLGIEDRDLFNCDMFVFCVSSGVPPVGKENTDVRMAQFEGNSRIIDIYAKKARDRAFQGIFAVVSDPVDLLCKAAFISSNKSEDGKMDYYGLAPEQIRGYGLGVMNARATYYAGQNPETAHYLREGRAYGPHGEGLVIADSIYNYNNDLSIMLTEKVKTANIEVRKTGFKPYIAPALSSGTLSLLHTIKGEWHYSAVFLGGVFMGVRNRLTPSGTEIESFDIPERLFERLNQTYESLRKIL